jgi:type II secretory ATPase GspE/PulE/Tfp pilus assembly ATPase PilB-like protein
MTRALMVVVAGPAGSGKSRHFPTWVPEPLR